MGRELKRKQAKKDKKTLKEEVIKKNENPYDDIYKLLKTFGIMLAIILTIYFFIAVVITKEIEWFSKDNEEASETNTVENSILAKNTFMQKEDEYYVYFYDFNDENTTITSLIHGTLYDYEIYNVDTSDAFNSNYVTDEELGNSSATSLDSLKVINPTLIKVSGDTIVEYYETEDNIISHFQ